MVLGVSMTPAAIRMVLVEGADGGGVTVDTSAVELGPGDDVVRQVLDAVVGTRKSIAADGHRLVSAGIVWTDHGQAARLRDALRTQGVNDVVMVSELHAAGALAQAAGRATGSQRTALLLIEPDAATLAVVRTVDGAVVGVHSRSLNSADASDVVARLADMTAALDSSAEAPEAVFLVGSGVDVASLSPRIAERTALPVHAPGEAGLALARGAALASATTPRFEATTVSIAPPAGDPDDLTAAGITQLGYSAPLGYSALAGDRAGDGAYGDGDGDDDLLATGSDPEQKPFLLVGSALASIFVVGVAALAISLAVTVRPVVEQRPRSGSVPGVPVQPAVPTGQVSTAPQTISAPLPVVQEAPRTVFVPRPAAPVTVVAPAAPVPAAPAPVPVVPPPAAPVVPAAVPAPLPAPVIPPIVLTPILPALLPPVFQAPVPSTPVPRSPSTTSVPATPAEEPTYPTSSSATSPATSSAPPPSPSTAPATTASTTASTIYAPTQETVPTQASTPAADSGVPVSGGSSNPTTPLWPTLSSASGDE